ncbi:MAG: TPM domain-containing protein [Nitrospirae bacterium]|nr:TPM domain-containing protein [Nitrospirota bacterium]
MAKIWRYLTPSDEERIRHAVVEAESQSRGEIVPMIVRASDSYAHIHVTGGIAFAVTAFAIGMMVWPEGHPAWFLMLELLGYVAGSLLFRMDGVKRLFLTHREMEARVFDRALRAFYEHELHKTKESTGILILASVLERRVRILADHGIHGKVGDAEWRKAANLLTGALKEKRTGDGFCEAIEVCGVVLARYFPAIGGKPGENPNELPDQPLQGE